MIQNAATATLGEHHCWMWEHYSLGVGVHVYAHNPSHSNNKSNKGKVWGRNDVKGLKKQNCSGQNNIEYLPYAAVVGSIPASYIINQVLP